METIELLKKKKKEKDFKILIHCFTGTKNFAFKLLDLNAFISASGVVTFKKSLDLVSTFKEIPNNRILVETDAPYLPPVPFRGKRNESSYILHIAEKLADVYGVSLKTIEEQTTQNALELFKL